LSFQSRNEKFFVRSRKPRNCVSRQNSGRRNIEDENLKYFEVLNESFLFKSKEDDDFNPAISGMFHQTKLVTPKPKEQRREADAEIR
jgi:hypothetical protein